MAARTAQLQIRVSESQKKRLRRLAAAAGVDMSSYVLERALPGVGAEFDRLVSRLVSAAAQSYVWAAIHDLLQALPPADFGGAVAGAPVAQLPAVDANILAAMVEHAAVLKQVEAPAWAMSIAPLERPWFGTSLRSARVRLHLLQASPPAYKRRNLFVDSAVGDRV
jgi:hypothetical protein